MNVASPSYRRLHMWDVVPLAHKASGKRGVPESETKIEDANRRLEKTAETSEGQSEERILILG